MSLSATESETGMDLLNKERKVLSPLMLAKKAAKNGQKVNACPFGCTTQHLDESGYCKHVIGITLPGNERQFEPMVRKKGRRVVQVEREKIPTGEMNEDGSEEFDWGPPLYGKVQPGDVLVRITTSCRVYREHVPEQPRVAEAKPLTAEQWAVRKQRLQEQLAEIEMAELEAAEAK